MGRLDTSHGRGKKGAFFLHGTFSANGLADKSSKCLNIRAQIRGILIDVGVDHKLLYYQFCTAFIPTSPLLAISPYRR